MIAARVFEQPFGPFLGCNWSRLVLTEMFVSDANRLVMDEPTNDLDAETLELFMCCGAGLP